MKSIILASSSPFRKKALESLGFTVSVIPHGIDERLPSHGNARTLARRLAYLKAADVSRHIRRGLILAADTLVYKRSKIFGTPTDAADARCMLRELSGSVQSVITALCLIDGRSGRFRTASEVTTLRMARLSDSDIEAYIHSGNWRGKAGAYSIKEYGDPWITIIKGNLDNACGFPSRAFLRLWQQTL